MDGFAALAIVRGLITSILWLVIGWRAMVAHEKIAAALKTAQVAPGGTED